MREPATAAPHEPPHEANADARADGAVAASPLAAQSASGERFEAIAAPPVFAPSGAAAALVHTPVSPRQYMWVVGAILVAAATLHWLGAVLTPFLIGAILAYLGTPVVNRCTRMGMPRTLGTLLAVALIIGLVLALVFVIMPLVQEELSLMLERMPLLADFYGAHIAPWLERTLGVSLALDIDTVRGLITDNAQQAGDIGMRVLGSVKSGGLLLINVLMNIALVPVVMFYLLRDGRGIVARVDELIPRRWDPVVRGMAHDIDHVLSEFLHGQMLVMISLSAYYVIGLSLVRLQYAVPIGILTGVLVFIPYIGFGTGLLLGVGAALLQWTGWPGFLAVMAVYGIGQLLENYVLLPYLVGHRIGLHPLAVIFALLAFGQLFGFAGVLLALPASAALLVALRRLRAAYLDSPIYRAQ